MAPCAYCTLLPFDPAMYVHVHVSHIRPELGAHGKDCQKETAFAESALSQGSYIASPSAKGRENVHIEIGFYSVSA